METISPILIGFFAGYFSGHFGVGGGFIMQPALRLIIGAPALVSLGTPIPVFVVSAVTGAFNYYRSGFVDTGLALYLALAGMVGTVLGSLATDYVNGDLILLITAAVLMATSLRFVLSGRGRAEERRVGEARSQGVALLASAIGLVVGFFSGFLGLGGGFLLVPALTLVFGKDVKTAIGTSLLVIIAYAIPGGLTHFALGHVDLRLMLLMALGIVPGAYVGSRVAIGLPDRLLRILFGLFLFTVAAYFAIFEINQLLTTNASSNS